MNIKFLSVIGILCWISVGSGAASLAKNAKIGNPHEPEQNFNKIKRKFNSNRIVLQDETTKTLIPDNFDDETSETEIEGSGDDLDLDLDDEDYDLDEYDYDDDDYYDDDLDEEGSGDDDLILPVEKEENSVKLKPDSNDNDDDFVFAEDSNHGAGKNGNGKSKIDEKDLLYEYYNDLIYDDDDDDDYYIDDEDLKVIDQDLGSSVSGAGGDGEIYVKSEIQIDSIPTDQTGAGLGDYAFRPAYVFLMLASALVSFAFFTLIFILCRRSMFQPQQKVFTMSGGYGLVPTKSSPIVKNPNKTPKPTKDMLNLNYVAPPPMMSTSTVEMGHTDTQKPLLR